MQTKTTLDIAAAVSGATSARVDIARTAPVELNLAAMRLVAGGLPRATWGAADAVAVEAPLPRATW